MAKRAERGKAYYMISAVSRKYGIHPQTLRLYEREGLLKPSRTDGNTRLYSEEDIRRLDRIKQMRDLLGFPLAEIKEMVEAEELLQQIFSTRRPDRELPERLQRAEQIIGALTKQLDVVEHKVEHLTLLREELRGKMTRMTQRRSEILSAMEQETTATR